MSRGTSATVAEEREESEDAFSSSSSSSSSFLPRAPERALGPDAPPRRSERTATAPSLHLRLPPLILFILLHTPERRGSEELEGACVHFLGRPACQDRQGQGRPTIDQAASLGGPLRPGHLRKRRRPRPRRWSVLSPWRVRIELHLLPVATVLFP